MNDPLAGLYWRDEIMQIMYWLRGEGLGEVVNACDLMTFLDAEEALIAEQLQRLVEEGFALRVDGAQTGFALTEMGIKEGGRRFSEEFDELTRQAHGECNNPNCDCHTLGPQACLSQTAHQHG
jgi:hypothetical protein